MRGEDGGSVTASLTAWLRAGLVGVVQAHAASAGAALIQVVWPQAHPWHLVASPSRPDPSHATHATPQIPSPSLPRHTRHVSRCGGHAPRKDEEWWRMLLTPRLCDSPTYASHGTLEVLRRSMRPRSMRRRGCESQTRMLLPTALPTCVSAPMPRSQHAPPTGGGGMMRVCSHDAALLVVGMMRGWLWSA